MTARNRSAADFFLIPDPTLESSPKDNLKNGSKEPYAQCIHIAFMSKKIHEVLYLCLGGRQCKCNNLSLDLTLTLQKMS